MRVMPNVNISAKQESLLKWPLGKSIMNCAKIFAIMMLAYISNVVGYDMRRDLKKFFLNHTLQMNSVKNICYACTQHTCLWVTY